MYLVAAYAQETQAVVAQLRTEGKGQELAAAKEMLGRVPLAGRLVTGDALLTQRGVSQQIVQRGGDYLLLVKDNQPCLRADLETAFSQWHATGLEGPTAPPWVVRELAAQDGRMVGVTEVEPKVRHGRREARRIWVLYDPSLNQYAGSAGEWDTPRPNLAQVCRVERRRTPWRRGSW